MNRITLSNLETVVSRINQITGSPEKPYIQVNGKCVAQIGCYHLSGAYGGYALHLMQTDGGGVKDIFYGHYPKAKLYELMHAFIKGLEIKA